MIQIPEHYYVTMEYLVRKAMEYRFLVTPNPTVGAGILYNGELVAEGFHTVFGGSHAEVVCLDNARKKGIPFEKAILFITLEPCSHFGKTPPCVQTIIQSGIRHVVIGSLDPHGIATGGVKILQQADIDVLVLKDKASRYAIQDFTMWQCFHLPHIIIKLATSLDGYIATRNYESNWITNQQTRLYTHQLREHIGRTHGAILVGANTVRYDNPKLYAKPHEQCSTHPRPIIISRSLQGIADSFLCTERAKETIIITTTPHKNTNEVRLLQERGITFIYAGEESLDLKSALASLYKDYGILYILCEGGGVLAHTLLQLNIPLELWHCVAPRAFADTQAIPMFEGEQLENLHDAHSFQLQSLSIFTDDIIAVYTKI